MENFDLWGGVLDTPRVRLDPPPCVEVEPPSSLRGGGVGGHPHLYPHPLLISSSAPPRGSHQGHLASQRAPRGVCHPLPERLLGRFQVAGTQQPGASLPQREARHWIHQPPGVPRNAKKPGPVFPYLQAGGVLRPTPLWPSLVSGTLCRQETFLPTVLIPGDAGPL